MVSSQIFFPTSIVFFLLFTIILHFRSIFLSFTKIEFFPILKYRQTPLAIFSLNYTAVTTFQWAFYALSFDTIRIGFPAFSYFLSIELK